MLWRCFCFRWSSLFCLSGHPKHPMPPALELPSLLTSVILFILQFSLSLGYHSLQKEFPNFEVCAQFVETKIRGCISDWKFSAANSWKASQKQPANWGIPINRSTKIWLIRLAEVEDRPLSGFELVRMWSGLLLKQHSGFYGASSLKILQSAYAVKRVAPCQKRLSNGILRVCSFSDN